MTNVILALQAITGLLSLMGNASIAVERLRVLIEAAEARGSDITDAELDALRAETDALAQQVIKELEP
ncbi:MAG: hypothetical protein ACR2PS_01140 [Pseudomonadales bacterium]